MHTLKLLIVFLPECFLTSGASELHTEILLSGVGDVTLILRCSSGDGNVDANGETERGVRDWGDSGIEDGERGSKLRLCAESVLLCPLERCVGRRERCEATGLEFWSNASSKRSCEPQ